MINFKVLFIGVVVLVGTWAGTVSADTLALQAGHPDRYVVVKGDTLWDIASRFLKDPWLWPKIWRINPAIENPNLIYPGDVILLKFEHGKPVLELQRGRQTVKLSPHTRTTSIESAIPTIPVDAIQQFLLHPRVVTQEQIDAAGYVVAQPEGQVIAGAGDTVYGRDLPDKSTPVYSIIRVGQAYHDPDTNDLLGYEAIQVGVGQVRQFGDPSTLFVSSSNREIMDGDRLLPIHEHGLASHFVPRSPDHNVSARIISVLDGVSRIGQYQTVVLNLGHKQGIQAGDVLAVYQEGHTVHDDIAGGKVKLPDRRAGLVMVVRPFERVSYALVMKAYKDMRILDKVTNP